MRETPLALIIEDEWYTAQMMVHTLNRAGIQALTAPAVLPGIHMAREQVPDIILLDLTLPGLGGATAALAVKDDPALANIPVVLVSAQPDLADVVEETGAAGLVAKPFNPLELVRCVRRCLQERVSSA
jgi:DNA-binding response OmpR family regulator